MKRTPVHTAVIAAALLATGTPGTPVQQWFEKANQAYHGQQYDSAITYYTKIVESGVHSSTVYFNLGNACFRNNQNGLAILNYERARRLSPADPDILANIMFANRNIVDRVAVPQRTFIGVVLWRLHTLLPLNTQLWCAGVLLAVLSGLFSGGLFVSRNTRLWLVYLGCLVLGAFILTGISAGIKIYQAENMREAIVLEKAVDARNQPDGQKVLFTVHEGTKFTIRKREGNWLLVSLPNGVSGWVSESSLGII
jgi:tetratricopeptide (TPR) repeat protein